MSEEKMAEANSRFVRQEDFVPVNSLEGKKVTVIGVGAIGRQVALQLAAIGVRELTLIDFDSVTPTNVTTQGFHSSDVGEEKVEVVEKSVKAVDPDIKVTAICDRFRPDHVDEESKIIFLCVDSVQARSEIWDVVQEIPGLVLVDGRMLGEVMRIITVSNTQSSMYYPSTLFHPSEAAKGRCTGQSTMYTANIAGGLMVHQMTRSLRGIPLDDDMCFNLLAGEFFPMGGVC